MRPRSRSTSEIVVHACERRGVAIVDPLMIDDAVDDVLASRARASILQWADDIKWSGRTPLLHRGGWKSPLRALEVAKPGCRELALAIAGAIDVKPERLQTWAMVNYTGAEHGEHTHGTVSASGICYLDDSKTPTLFRLPSDGPSPPVHDPTGSGRQAPGAPHTNIVVVPPRRGRIAVFSGWLPHRVPPVLDAERITIAFNVL